MLKIISWNIKGARDKKKRIKIRKCIKLWKLGIVILQETKLERCTDRIVHHLWGRGDIGWVALDAIGLSGGILIIWNNEVVQVKDEIKGTFSGFMVLVKWTKGRECGGS
ncbi:hypothetical protein BVC80_1229g10 [Macleaya cordata]|uniref:Endonuclease/exonuclease/phosphatase n=1 Tax=Macleaya cordata TaxID=56857 RepID=A0A200QYA3_MACCD|nr:hypothetical protein BVC80_1229g10 [Macleaya cordata]